MELVLAHTNTDFDSLASQLAVTKLAPAARMVPGYPLGSDVRGFLALYRDSLPLVELAYIDVAKVEHIYVVDCQHIERLDALGKRLIKELGVPYTVFDHHPFDPEGLACGARSDSIIETAGSCTSLIVDRLRQRNIEVKPLEATLLLIGIYEDSGCLTYRETRPVDARAVEYLLAAGADLTQVNNYLNTKLTDEQTTLFQDLSDKMECFTISGAKIVVAHAERNKYIEGLATITRRMLDLNQAEAAATVVRMKDRIYIVGRSDSPAINVRDLARHLGGDGHPGAASAVSRNDLSAVTQEVIDWFKVHVGPEATAREIMSSPVRTVTSDMTMSEAGKIMLRYLQDGLIVGTADQIVGIVSRRDVDKAKHHNLGHAPVSGFMSRPVITIKADAAVSEIQRLMVKHDIGRLPVLDEVGSLIGVVTRKDILRKLFGVDDSSFQPKVVAQERRIHLHKRMEEMDEPSRWLFRQVGEIAESSGMVAYAVGGCVRDLFLERKNFDLDFVIEGNAIELAEALASAYPGRLHLIAKHDRFKTCTLRFFAGVDRDVDLSTARIEFYEFPAALPTVEPSVLEQDLFRRDFTINALAICLNPGQYGDVIDFFDGVTDMDQRLIRILHQFSFVEDPTRIVRAVRFAVRLGFELESDTREQAERAVQMGIFDELGGFRLKEELRLILESEHRWEGLKLLNEIGAGLAFITPGLSLSETIHDGFQLLESLLPEFNVEGPWVIFAGLLLSCMGKEAREAAMERLTFTNDERNWIRSGLDLARALEERSCAGMPRSVIYWLFHGLCDQALLLAASASAQRSHISECVLLYLRELRSIKPNISGDDLILIGFTEGPQIREALSRIHEAKLDGTIDTVQQEINLARQFLD